MVIRERLVCAMLTNSIKQEEMSVALHMSSIYTSVLLRNTKTVVPFILNKMQKEPEFNTEITLSIL